MWIVESNVSLPFVVLTGYRRNFLFIIFLSIFLLDWLMPMMLIYWEEAYTCNVL